MGYSSFQQAKEFVAAGYGECNKEILGEVVNAIRQHWYNWYQEVALFMDAIECFCVQRFCVDCNNCRDSYRGVTLPREFQTVEAMWFNDFAVNLRSEWREWQNGITPECDCRLQKIDIPGSFSTFADLLPGRPSRLSVFATHPDDAGKKFTIQGEDAGGVPRVEQVVLAMGGVGTEWPFRSINNRGGIMKEVTKGRVLLTDESGRKLGVYEPDETVPTYRRIKITGLSDDCSAVNIRAARRYYPLYDDFDVVETDNRMAFDSMARYLRLFRRSDKDGAALTSEKNYLLTAKAMILGEKAREKGKSTNTEVRIAVPHFYGKRLKRTRC